jgi:hypothetical protein
VDNKVIPFFSDEEKGSDENYMLDLTNSRARIITKSPWDKTDRITKTKLKFFESEILWREGRCCN